MNNNPSELDVTVVESTRPVGLSCRSHWEEVDFEGKTLDFLQCYAVENAALFRKKLLEKEGRDSKLSMYLDVWLPDRKQNEGLGFFGLQSLLERHKLPPKPEPWEPELMEETSKERYLREYATREEAIRFYGPDLLSLHLDGKVAVTTSDGVVSQQEGLMDHTQCTLLPVGEFVFAAMLGTYFAVPNVSKAARQAITTRNKMLGFVVPPELETWARNHSPRGQGLAPAAALTNVAIVSNFKGDRDFHFGLTQLERRGAWLTNEDEGFKYYSGRAVSVTYKPPELFSEDWWARQRKETLAALDRRFASIRNDMTADIVDVLFHHWHFTKRKHQSPTGVEKAVITLRQICEYRGITANKNNIERAYLAMRNVRGFRLAGGSVEEALFDISTVETQPGLWNQEEPPQADTAFVYSPGFFLAQAVQDGPHFFAPFIRRVWALDPHNDALAKRLMRYLRGEWRMNMGKYLRAPGQAPTRYRTWINVLTDSGIDFENSEARKNPSRFIESIQDALNTLHSLEAIHQSSTAIYHPEDLRLFESLSRKGILAHWLSFRVCIDPPKDVCEELNKPNAQLTGYQAALTQAQARAEVKARPASKRPTKSKRYTDKL